VSDCRITGEDDRHAVFAPVEFALGRVLRDRGIRKRQDNGQRVNLDDTGFTEKRSAIRVLENSVLLNGDK